MPAAPPSPTSRAEKRYSMSVRNDCEDAFSRAIRAANHDLLSSRRSLLLAPLLAALPLVLSDTGAARQQARSVGDDDHPSGRHQMGCVARRDGSAAQQRDGDALRRLGSARALSRADEVVSRLHERAT